MTIGRVGVTGASGYVGRHLIRELLARGASSVVAIDRSEAAVDERVHFVCADIESAGELEAALAGCEAVVHLACMAIGPSAQDPVGAFRANALAAVRVAETSRKLGVRRIVMTSTSEVYGDVGPEPVGEAHPAVPLNPYAASKLAGEIGLSTIARGAGIPFLVLRLFNVLGPSLAPSPRATAPDIFAREAVHGRAPRVMNAAEAKDFVHVRDVAAALATAVSCSATDQVINIGSGEATTLHALAEIANELSGNAAGVEVAAGNLVRRPLSICADISRAREVLAFVPRVTLREAMAELVADALQARG